MNVEAYNFRKPGPLASDLEQRLAAWLREFCAQAPEKWASRLALQIEMKFVGLETIQPASALAQLPEASSAYRVSLKPSASAPPPTAEKRGKGDEGDATTLVVLPRTLALLLVGAAVGESGTQLPADRAMTVVEESLCDYLVGRLFLAAMQDSWPGMEPVNLALQQREPSPKKTRMFSPDANAVMCAFQVHGPFGQQEWHWIVPQEQLLTVLSQSGQPLEHGQEQVVRPRLEAIIQELPVEISVNLGSVEVPLARLLALRAGDVVLLDQRISEPLLSHVAGMETYRVWAGRVGGQRALQVAALIEE